jgi:RNA polymerase sigma-70 factor (ECF subfamily)
MSSPERRDEDWFTRLYAAHYGQVLNYGRRRLADVDAAAELAQDVFVVAWRRRDQVPATGLPWLYAVARRLLANRWRAGRAAAEPMPAPELDLLADHRPSPDDSAARLVDVRAALARLSGADQEVLRLVGWEELSLGEAGQVLGCSRATAAVRLHRARRRLGAVLADGHPPAPPPPARLSTPAASPGPGRAARPASGPGPT